MKTRIAVRILSLTLLLAVCLFSFQKSAFAADFSQPPAPSSQTDYPVANCGPRYHPEKAFIDTHNNRVYFVCNNCGNLYLTRYDLSSQSFLDPFSLAEKSSVVQIAYASVNNRMYVAYGSGHIDWVSLDQPIQEHSFLSLSATPDSLTVIAGQYLLVSLTNTSTTHTTYTPGGQIISQKSGMLPVSPWAIWNAAAGELFFFSNGTLHKEQIDANGVIGNLSPEFGMSGGNLLAVNEDGTRLLITHLDNTGDVLNQDFSHLAHIDVIGGVWANGSLYTLSYGGYETVLLKCWDGQYNLVKQLTLPGNADALLKSANGLVAIVDDSSSYFIVKANLDLNWVSIPPKIAYIATTPYNTHEIVPFKLSFEYHLDPMSGPVDSYLWDFGDGTTSTLQSPEHTYTRAGRYTLTLTLTGPGGQNVSSNPDYVQADQKTFLAYLPNRGIPVKPYLKTGSYPFNFCQQYPFLNGSTTIAQITQCLTGVEVGAENVMKVDLTWKVDYISGSDESLNKKSDIKNPKMYLVDNLGLKIPNYAGGGSAGPVSYIVGGDLYSGWLVFSPTEPGNTFVFHDDDQHLTYGPFTIPLIP